jgi:hypothetical protein
MIWEDLERQFIYTTLNKRKEDNISKASTSSMKVLVIDQKTRIEMNKQNEKWETTNRKFDKILEVN